MQPKTRGFTLIELLVAITVLSLVSLISWRGLESLTATRMRLEPEAEEIRAMLTAFGQMELDLEQVANPTYLGLPVAAISVQSSGGQPALEIIRLAPVDSDQATAIERVVYSLKDGQLTRGASAAARTAASLAQAPLTETALLSNVTALQIRYWHRGQGWADASADVAPTPDNPSGLPEGVEVTLVRS
ncbi:MAG: type II secretion system protein GspJ, partial [Gemmatimonadota bacterium]